MHSPLAQQHAQAAGPAAPRGPRACLPRARVTQHPSAQRPTRPCHLRLLCGSRAPACVPCAPSLAQRPTALCSMGSSPFQVLHTFFFLSATGKYQKKYIYLFSFIFQYTNKFIKIYFIILLLLFFFPFPNKPNKLLKVILFIFLF